MPALKPKPQEQAQAQPQPQPPQSPPPANGEVEYDGYIDHNDPDSWWTWPEESLNMPGDDYIATLIERPGEKPLPPKSPADLVAKVEHARRLRAEQGEVVIKDEDNIDLEDVDSWWIWPEETLNTTRDDHAATLIEDEK